MISCVSAGRNVVYQGELQVTVLDVFVVVLRK